MELTPQTNEILTVEPSGRRSFVLALFGLSARDRARRRFEGEPE